jgi:uncharacterized protein
MRNHKDEIRKEGLNPFISELSEAISRHNIQKVDKILSLGLDINDFDDIGSTPLFSSVCRSNSEIVKKLLNAGANPNIGDKENAETPLMRSIEEPCNPYYYRDNNFIFNLLLNSGADPNAQSSDGETALMRAARFGNLKAIHKLIEYGANIAIKDDDLRSAIDYAILGLKENDFLESDVYEKIIILLQPK